MEKRSFCRWCGGVVLWFAVLACASRAPAQNNANTLNRPYEAVILSGDRFAEFAGSSIAPGECVLFLYAFRAETQQWEQIPFQWDERDTSGSFFNPTGDEILGLDNNDELAFMAADAGDWAPTSWIPDPGSKDFIRYEIKLIDPLDPQKNGWVYLYKSLTDRKTFAADYVNYIASADPGTGEDFVESDVYKIGGNAEGIFAFLSLQPNPAVNLLDRQKIRGKTDFFLLPDFDEDSDLTFVRVEAIDGAVRVIRQITLELAGLLEVSLPLQYFRHSVLLEGNLVIPTKIEVSIFEIKVKEIRHSIDLSAAAMGMELFNPNNAKVPIDGEDDPNVNKQIDFLPKVNYIHITGTQGTIIDLIKVPDGIGDNRELYYQDKTNIGDPGDGNAFGDAGVRITGNDIEGEFPLALKLVLLSGSQPVSVGSELALFEESPLSVELMPQASGTVPVELVSFSARVVDSEVVLEWVTASESNNFGFQVQRKAGDGEWLRIGFVSGAGTTTETQRYTFRDAAAGPGVLFYRLKQLDTDGAFEYTQAVSVTFGVPEVFALAQNYPNPFNPTTEIRYQIPARDAIARDTELAVYNLLGQKVRTLVREQQGPGFYSVTWDATDEAGIPLPSGVYAYQLRSGGFAAVKKMLLVR